MVAIFVVWVRLGGIGKLSGLFLTTGFIWIGEIFLFTRYWAATDSIIFKIRRQPIGMAGVLAVDIPAQVYGKISVNRFFSYYDSKRNCNKIRYF